MAIPGKQFPIRREVPHLVDAAFEEAGYRFASREAVVQVQKDASAVALRFAIGAAASHGFEEAKRV